MADWYTRQEVAELLGISKSTVYHYAKQDKIKKIPDPHRLHRETRYEKKEVDELIEERKQYQPTGSRPSELAKRLKVPIKKIYDLIKEHELEVDILPAGDEKTIISIPESTVKWIEEKINRIRPARGTRLEFYDSGADIALYQLFKTPSGQDVRLIRNDDNEWGFSLVYNSWIPFAEGIKDYKLTAAYPLHHETLKPEGYADFELPKNQLQSFDFLDYIYQTWGIENIRMREYETYLALSIKSGEIEETVPLPSSLTEEQIRSFLVKGNILKLESKWLVESGYRRTTVDLPIPLLEEIQRIADDRHISMSEVVEEIVSEKLTKKD